MAIATKNVGVKGTDKRSKILALAYDHRVLFEKEGVSSPKFIPRLCYKHTNGAKVIGFYPKELYGGMDIYVEFCDRDYNPEDPERTLYKWIYNPHYDEYALSDPHPATKDRRYLIPIDELINVTEIHSKSFDEPLADILEPASESVIESSTIAVDGSYQAMTICDYAAIQWKKPVSNKPWLNELITKTFKE